jgi:crossover junction endodeoxyribonuclease RuvC
MLIIGIDPGSRITGYGIIDVKGQVNRYVASGSLHAPLSQSMNERLQYLFTEIKRIVQHYQPNEASIEQVFMHQNPNSALKLGQARGAAIVALDLPIAEYSARQVKQSVVGFGAAKKEQVQHMVKRLLSLHHPLQADEADALAIALCHAHTRSNPFLLNPLKTPRKKRSSWRNFNPVT